MKIENIVSWVEIDPTSLGCWACVLTIIPPILLYVTTISCTHTPVKVTLCLRDLQTITSVLRSKVLVTTISGKATEYLCNLLSFKQSSQTHPVTYYYICLCRNQPWWSYQLRAMASCVEGRGFESQLNQIGDLQNWHISLSADRYFLSLFSLISSLIFGHAIRTGFWKTCYV